ncbi:MAG: SMP-30/gluconolactonase/LRE family protein [Pseudonocardiaceae bacterium]
MVFFTDPPFGLPGGYDDPKRELPFSGVFAARDGTVVLVTDELAGPNGLGFSPDERYLYVANWEAGASIVRRYEVAADGSAGPGELLVDLSDEPGEDSQHPGDCSPGSSPTSTRPLPWPARSGRPWPADCHWARPRRVQRRGRLVMPGRQRNPALLEQAGQAFQPCARSTFSATAICCDRLAWLAVPA